jgi:hypothetical protein
MASGGLRRGSWTHLLWVVALVVTNGTSVTTAHAGGSRILTVAKDTVYGGATGLLLGGVLTLVVPADSRGDVVRWGVVVGAFAGFGYGVYEARGQDDEFSEQVRARAEARLRAGRVSPGEDTIAPARTTGAPGGSLLVRDAPTIGFLGSPRLEDRPPPATGEATGRTS